MAEEEAAAAENADCHVAEFPKSSTLCVIESFQAVLERVIDEGAQVPVTIPIACAKLLECSCVEDTSAAGEMRLFARNGESGKLLVSLPLNGSFLASVLPFGSLRLHAPPASSDYVLTFQSETISDNTLGCLRRFAVVMGKKAARFRGRGVDADAEAGSKEGADRDGGGANGATEPQKVTLNQFGQKCVPIQPQAGGEAGSVAPPLVHRSGLLISKPVDTRRMAHVEFDASNQTFAGVPRNMESEFARIAFNLPLSRVTSVPVKGYEEDIPLVLVILREYLLKLDGVVETGIFRIAPDKGECAAAKNAICLENRVDLEEVRSPHVFANLIKQWFRDLPGGLLNELGVGLVAQCAEEGLHSDPFCNIILKLSPRRRSIFLWLLDLMALPVLNEEVTMMGPKNMAIVVSPNLWLTDLSADPMTSLVFSQQLSKFLTAILEWRISNTPPSDAYHHRHIKKAEDASKGDRVEVSRLDGSKCRGIVQYVGEVAGKSGVFIGVALDGPFGFNDGCTADGTRYFQCAPKHGLFVRPMRIRVLRPFEIANGEGATAASENATCTHGQGPSCADCASPEQQVKTENSSSNRSGGGGAREKSAKTTGPAYRRAVQEHFEATGFDMSNTGYLSTGNPTLPMLPDDG